MFYVIDVEYWVDELPDFEVFLMEAKTEDDATDAVAEHLPSHIELINFHAVDAFETLEDAKVFSLEQYGHFVDKSGNYNF